MANENESGKVDKIVIYALLIALPVFLYLS